ncbi:MAG: hypothetical protein HRU32_05765 [Rhodobacteraceae bacterium]|nr:hypothetical protein [Paracoccaceae bacterium]
MSKIDMYAAEARAKHYAKTIGVAPPSKLMDAERAPTDELLTFCNENGMSLDWVFLGDVAPMVRASFRASM